MSGFPKDFYWGGATADFQYEGGFNEGNRGLLSHDYETDGSMEHPRHHTMKLADGTIKNYRSSFFYADQIPEDATPVFLDNEYYPSHQAVDFYHHYIYSPLLALLYIVQVHSPKLYSRQN